MTKYFFISISTIIVTVFASGCDFFQTKKTEVSNTSTNNDGVVARVKDKKLYVKDLYGIGAKEKKEDSIALVNRFVKSWIKKELLMDKAQSNVQINSTEIERKVQDYRYELMVYDFKKKYIAEKLDPVVTDDEIVEYYNQNIDNYKLKHSIVKCHFMKIPAKAPKIDKAKKWFKSNTKSDLEKIKTYAIQFSPYFIFDDSTWYQFLDVTKGTPFRSIPNEVQFLKQNRYTETQDSNFVYLLKILNYKLSDDISPLVFVKEQIMEIILNRRKLELIYKLEEGIYEQAQKNGTIEIY